MSISALSTIEATHPRSSFMGQAAVHMFLEQLVYSLYESEWTKRTMSSKYQGSVSHRWLMFLTTHIQTKKRVAIVVVPPPTVVSSSSSRWSDFQGFKGLALPPPLHFLFFPFWKSELDYDIQIQLHIWGKLESDCASPGKGTGS